MARTSRLRLRALADPAQAGPLFRDAGFRGSEADPISCRAAYDHSGMPRRIVANFPGGWRCDLRFWKDGSYSLTQSVSISVRALKGAA